jgi:hypothetical protein
VSLQFNSISQELCLVSHLGEGNSISYAWVKHWTIFVRELQELADALGLPDRKGEKAQSFTPGGPHRTRPFCTQNVSDRVTRMTTSLCVPATIAPFKPLGGNDLDTEKIVQLLKAQRGRIDRAIAALEGGTAPRRTAAGSVTSRGSQLGKRQMSAEARKRISDAQKKRWAKQKKGAK